MNYPAPIHVTPLLHATVLQARTVHVTPVHAAGFTAQQMEYAIALLVVLAIGAIAVGFMLRKMLRGRPSEQRENWSKPAPAADNASAFATASMQGVIERLRAQEKELARLHLLAQERAQESERLTDEVTRNM